MLEVAAQIQILSNYKGGAVQGDNNANSTW